MPNKKTSDFYLRKSQREMKKAYRSAEKNDRLKMLAECAGSLNFALSALLMELQEIKINQAKK